MSLAAAGNRKRSAATSWSLWRMTVALVLGLAIAPAEPVHAQTYTGAPAAGPV